MSGPDPAVAAVRSAVAAITADVPADGLVLVACSGGPDSLALAAATAFVADRARRRASGAGGWRAGAVVVDHGLQAGSAQVARRAADACRTLGLDPVHVVAVAPDGPGGPEAAARDARYAAIDAVADATGAHAVLLGHTLDDQAETVLLGLGRGSGVRALAGMAAVRGRLRRPLLALRRADTLRVCEVLALDPWHDPTNTPTAEASSGPRRSRLRALAVPALVDVLGPGVPGALARTADQLREAADTLDTLADALLADALLADALRPDGPLDDAQLVDGPLDDDPSLRFDVDALLAAPTGLRRWALRAAAVRAGSPAGSLRREHVLALDALLTGWHGQGPVALPGPAGVPTVGWRACGTLGLGPAGRPGSRPEPDPEPPTDDRQER
ncbi:tRNA lysidine(34) synthetase TilS [Cellulomonas soli]|uniref:tRNA(Ile)-lysidine synthase n=1 Tax=Cellulomonas soli TaxID=931535 RepID=A0A512PEY7_9CELL|nr:tRNA lysidine(34) synthetase TilS [Cellulomonas soli]NYI59431.1 tRNA(Ile)-lysidine synthetase-like protein [Cellulomonas soli]GEP69777.1 tRNA(Ile)-lysidine synthase [Cellulomonas soli]